MGTRVNCMRATSRPEISAAGAEGTDSIAVKSGNHTRFEEAAATEI